MRTKRPNTVLFAIIFSSSIWLVTLAVSIYRTNVAQAGMKSLVLLGVAGLFLGGWALA